MTVTERAKAPRKMRPRRWSDDITAAAIARANTIGTGHAAAEYGITEQALRMAFLRSGYRRGWVRP